MVTNFAYDPEGRFSETEDYGTGANYVNATTSYTYNEPYPFYGLPDSITAPDGNVGGLAGSGAYTTSDIVYNDAGQILSERSRVAPGQYVTQSYTYNSRGDMTSSTDGNLNTTTYTYNLLDRVLTTKLPRRAPTTPTATRCPPRRRPAPTTPTGTC